mmetsp:Transcript_23370/g.32743  ORF Transcript_23370/g.32743 Transcript_23370/m.32743 type:complete len:293 (+) Transcript_23370:146-1024(+)
MKARKTRRTASCSRTASASRKPHISAYYIFFQEEKEKIAKTHKEMTPRDRLKYIASKWRKLDLPTRCVYEQNARDKELLYKLGGEQALHNCSNHKQDLPIQQHQQLVAPNKNESCGNIELNSFTLHNMMNDNNVDGVHYSSSCQWESPPSSLQQNSTFIGRNVSPDVSSTPRHNILQEEMSTSMMKFSSRTSSPDFSDFPIMYSNGANIACYESDNNPDDNIMDLDWSFKGSYVNEQAQTSLSELMCPNTFKYKGNLQERINCALAITNSFRDDDFVNFVADLFGKSSQLNI